MMLFLNFVILLAGFAALIKGADWFVEGSSQIARKFRIPGVIIGLTIVALGTSAPELAVSTSAALQNANEIALSNVLGSNLFNTLCVLGVCAAIHRLPVDESIVKRDLPFSIVVTLLILLLSAAGGVSRIIHGDIAMGETVGLVSRPLCAVLLLVFVSYIVLLIREARRNPEEASGSVSMSLWKCILLLIVGIGLIVAGGQAVVYSAKEIARAAGMSETLIGLTVVALGTSLPELVTSVVAARKGETSMAIGNVIGSNLFNLMFVLGISSFIHPVAVNMASVFDMIILTGVSLLLFFFVFRKRSLNRVNGLILLGIYAADMVFAILR